MFGLLPIISHKLIPVFLLFPLKSNLLRLVLKPLIEVPTEMIDVLSLDAARLVMAAPPN